MAPGLKNLAIGPTYQCLGVLWSRRERSCRFRFSDASKKGVCAAVYVVGTYCDGRKSQHLLVSKARVAPKHFSIPRPELVEA